MSAPIAFKAPWSRSLRTTSLVVVSVLLAAIGAGLFGWLRTGALASVLAMVLPLVILLASMLCMVKGYVLTDEAIVVKRLGWSTDFPLEGLRSVSGDNEAMLSSVRLFANGGLLSYAGYFWSRRMGRYRALATDPSRAVVLRYAKRKIVLTPDDPQRFIVRLRTMLKNRE